MTATVAAALAHVGARRRPPLVPRREGSAASPWPSTATRCGASLAAQLRALERVCRVRRHVHRVGQAPRRALRGGGQGRRHLRDVARRGARMLRRRRVALVLPSGCHAMAMAPARRRCRRCEEGFCDRAYRPDGGLVDRHTAGAVLDDPGRPRRPGAQPGPRRGGGGRRQRADAVGRHAVRPRRLAGRRGHRDGGAPGAGGVRHRRASRRPACMTRSVPGGEVRPLGDRALLVGVDDAGSGASAGAGARGGAGPAGIAGAEIVGGFATVGVVLADANTDADIDAVVDLGAIRPRSRRCSRQRPTAAPSVTTGPARDRPVRLRRAGPRRGGRAWPVARPTRW